MFKFKECFEKYGFVADFDNADYIAEIMNINERDYPDWYDDYFAELVDFAKDNRLIKYVYKAGEHAEIFFAENADVIINYIAENFYTEDGDYLEKDAIKNDIDEYEPLPTVSEILEKLNIKVLNLATMFRVPSRTMQSWAYGERIPAEYTMIMIVELLRLKYHYDEIKDIKEYY